MGRRTLRVEAALFVEFFKCRDGLPRTFSVQRGLPDDARVVEERLVADHLLGIVLESAEWAGVDDSPIPTPLITVHFEMPELLGIVVGPSSDPVPEAVT